MAKTDQYTNLKIDSVKVLEELRDLDLDSATFDVTVDAPNDKASVKVSETLLDSVNNNAIAYAISLG